MKIKCNSDDDLPSNKPLEVHIMTIIIRSVFEEDGKLYPQVFLDDFQKFFYLSKECDICRYWYFKDIGFKYEPYLSNGCHDLMQKAMSFNNIAIVYVKGNTYRIHFGI